MATKPAARLRVIIGTVIGVFFCAPLPAFSSTLPIQSDTWRVIESFPKVQDQGSRNTCNAFAASALVESALVRARLAPPGLNLSEEWAASEVPKKNGLPLMLQPISEVVKALLRAGVVTEAELPYGQPGWKSNATLKARLATSALASRERWVRPARFRMGLGLGLGLSRKKVHDQLARGIPVGVSMNFDPKYAFTGVLDLHSLVLVGYDDASGVYYARNSWGTSGRVIQINGRPAPGYVALPQKTVDQSGAFAFVEVAGD